MDICYVIVDGMSETTPEGSSLSLANTPYMDAAADAGIVGIYTPVVAPGDREPKTDVVVPALFGLPPEDNPGRSNLEVCDLDGDLDTGSCFYGVQVTTRDAVSSEDWRHVPPTPSALAREVDDVIVKSAIRYGGVAITNGAANVGTHYIVGVSSRSQPNPLQLCRELLADLERELNALELALIVSDLRPVSAGLERHRGSRTDIVFLGWAKGSLRGSFKYLGATCNPFTRPPESFYSWIDYETNFHSWCIPAISRHAKQHKTFVLYTKETAFASRRGDGAKKIEAIEFMDRMTGLTLAQFENDVVLVVLADHSADMRGHTNPSTNTVFLAAVWSAGRPVGREGLGEHFCESYAAARCRGRAISQAALGTLVGKLAGGGKPR